MTETDGILGGINAWVEASVKMTTKMDEVKRAVDRLNYNTPVLRRLANSGVAATGVNLVIDLGTPDSGTYWDVENVFIGGVEVTSTAAGTAGLYVVGGFNGVSPGVGNAVDYAATMPNASFYGLRDLVVQDGEHLVIVVFGGTNAQTYVVSSSISVYNVRAGAGRDVNVVGI